MPYPYERMSQSAPINENISSPTMVDLKPREALHLVAEEPIRQPELQTADDEPLAAY